MRLPPSGRKPNRTLLLETLLFPQQLVLIPKYTELPGFRGNEPAAERRREDMAGYMCADSFLMTPAPALAEVCSSLICSISSILHDGALRKCPPRPRPLLAAPGSPRLLWNLRQPVAATLKAPSAASAARWGVSVSAKPTWSASAATAAPQEATASESTAALVSVCDAAAHTHTLGHMIDRS